ncbi:hypothetical protein SPOG_02089 [Schizosaccharomyces cryophilus OY26]|uniref:Uncharacterized protein n=1 Tax=Schizosaccharomyces cryophilus (strain OY26 / ATCC MYA-4695 / CBS 11777 / NBRC 106824 / NRRL Y48691) TaxID=653667 RepID=S9W442_SCHCR|nr:uncharacterized protein SPOG_02089 [Schizosaccharomyces cryophilus OY26]EPY52770.1 hypothetical protein SPOG_02089 [Schizosaccharomyces cryophilus OY26]
MNLATNTNRQELYKNITSMGFKRSYSSLNYDVSRKKVLNVLEIPLKKLTIEDPSDDLDVEMVPRNRIAYYKNKYTVVVEDLDAELEEEEDNKKKNSSSNAEDQSRVKLSVISPLEKKLKRDLFCLLFERPTDKKELPCSGYSSSCKSVPSVTLPESKKLFEEGKLSFTTNRTKGSRRSLESSYDLDLG